METLIVDSWAWMEFFNKSAAYRKVLMENELKTPAIVSAELSRAMVRHNIGQDEAKSFLDFIASKSLVLALNHEQAIKAGQLAEQEKLHLSDAIIYSYASEKEKLLTGDEHFKGKKNVLFLK